MRDTPQLLGLIGHHTRESLSPLLHNALARKYRVALQYLAMDFPATALAALPLIMRQCDIIGLNVTAPYKARVVPILGRVVGAAARLGVVNTIVRRGEKLHGYNTDLAGVHALVRRALPHATTAEFRAMQVALLGNGDTALTTAFALWQCGVRNFLCFGRNPAQVRRFLQRVQRVVRPSPRATRPTRLGQAQSDGSTHDSLHTHAYALHELPSLLRRRQPMLICQTTSAPRAGADALKFPPLAPHYHPTVLDLRTGCGPNRFLDTARAHGCPAHDGLAMLLEQAAAAWTIWTGIDPDRQLLQRAATRWQST